MSQSPIAKFVHQSKSDNVSAANKHRDSPRPATSAENLVFHALKRLKLQTGSEPADQLYHSAQPDELLHKVSSPRRGRYAAYSIAEKLDALEQVLLHGVSATSLRLNIPTSTISTWKKELLEGQGSLSLHSPVKGKRHWASARKLLYRPVEDGEELAKWLSELRIKKKTVTFENIRTKVRAKLGEDAFEAKSGWLTDFMTKHDVTLEAKSREAIAETDRVLRDFLARRTQPASTDDDGSTMAAHPVRVESSEDDCELLYH